tara:strand:+ start:421 stop:543 length:123 start_codon:yes stop_codon:yes gene_type:complete
VLDVESLDATQYACGDVPCGDDGEVDAHGDDDEPRLVKQR